MGFRILHLIPYKSMIVFVLLFFSIVVFYITAHNSFEMIDNRFKDFEKEKKDMEIMLYIIATLSVFGVMLAIAHMFYSITMDSDKELAYINSATCFAIIIITIIYQILMMWILTVVVACFVLLNDLLCMEFKISIIFYDPYREVQLSKRFLELENIRRLTKNFINYPQIFSKPDVYFGKECGVNEENIVCTTGEMILNSSMTTTYRTVQTLHACSSYITTISVTRASNFIVTDKDKAKENGDETVENGEFPGMNRKDCVDGPFYLKITFVLNAIIIFLFGIYIYIRAKDYEMLCHMHEIISIGTLQPVGDDEPVGPDDIPS